MPANSYKVPHNIVKSQIISYMIIAHIVIGFNLKNGRKQNSFYIFWQGQILLGNASFNDACPLKQPFGKESPIRVFYSRVVQALTPPSPLRKKPLTLPRFYYILYLVKFAYFTKRSSRRLIIWLFAETAERAFTKAQSSAPTAARPLFSITLRFQSPNPFTKNPFVKSPSMRSRSMSSPFLPSPPPRRNSSTARTVLPSRDSSAHSCSPSWASCSRS